MQCATAGWSGDSFGPKVDGNSKWQVVSSKKQEGEEELL